METGKAGSLVCLLGDLVAGRLVSCPFPEESTSRLRLGLADVLQRRGFWFEALENDQPQPVRVRLLGGFLRACDDPDWFVMGKFAKGVRIGVVCPARQLFFQRRHGGIQYQNVVCFHPCFAFVAGGGVPLRGSGCFG